MLKRYMHFTITNSRPLGLEFVMALISWMYQSWPQHLPTFVAPEFQALRAIVHKRIHWVHGHPVMRLVWWCLVTYRPTNSWPSHPFCWTEITQTNKQLIPWSCADAIAVIDFLTSCLQKLLTTISILSLGPKQKLPCKDLHNMQLCSIQSNINRSCCGFLPVSSSKDTISGNWAVNCCTALPPPAHCTLQSAMYRHLQ